MSFSSKKKEQDQEPTDRIKDEYKRMVTKSDKRWTKQAVLPHAALHFQREKEERPTADRQKNENMDSKTNNGRNHLIEPII